MHPSDPPLAAGVVCHAHPLHGGIMHFKVVFRAAKALQEKSVAALRFNFRGVGRSEGTHDYGRGEQDDVLAAAKEMQRRFPGLPLILGGFSFGAVMAMRVAQSRSEGKAAFALGFPLSMAPDASFLERLRVPCLFVQGENDAFGSAQAMRQMVARLQGSASFLAIAGSDHFFTGHLDEVQQALAGWVGARPWADGMETRP